MTLPEETRMPSPSLDSGSPGSPYEEGRHQWDINDTNLPAVREHEVWQEWPDSHCKYIYLEESEESRRHSSGWAMRNTNNHNVNILKKSCLGVLVCTMRCVTDSGASVRQRPAICDKARKKQLGKACPNSRCQGRLELQPCRGHGGYPVTHFWRHINGYIFFQAKGIHDHSKPETKSSPDARRHQFRDSRVSLYERRNRKRPLSSAQSEYPQSKIQHLDHSAMEPLVIAQGKPGMCSCPPFECVCHVIPHQQQVISRHPQAAYNNNSCLYSVGSHNQQQIDAKNLFQQTDFQFTADCTDSYNEYFDFSGQNAMNQGDVYKPNGYHCDMNQNKGYSVDFPPTAFFNTDVPIYNTVASKLDHSEKSACMYSGERNVQLDSPSAAHNSSSADSGVLSICGQLSPASSIDSSLRFNEQTTTYMNHPGDFLSLDQPINKTNCLASRDKANDSRANIASTLMSSLLPSINAFPDEEQQKPTKDSSSFHQYIMSPQNGSIVRPEMISPGSSQGASPIPCATSPPSLTELQTVNAKREPSTCIGKTGITNTNQYVSQDSVYSFEIIPEKEHTSSHYTYIDQFNCPDFDFFSFYIGDVCNTQTANVVR